MLLTTKFFRPTPDPRAIQRPRLVDDLEPRAAKRLNLIIAPAGFGKTTLVSQWCDRNSSRPAWLSLDRNDDEPRRFWQYICGAFERAGVQELDAVQRTLQGCSGPEIEGAITQLINVLVEAETKDTRVLVLDDYHEIENPAIHRQLAYFIDYLPPHLLVTIISRTEPPMPVSRWRVRHWVDDTQPRQLAFSEDECQRFFEDYMAMPTPAERVRDIWQQTEGWVAAMQLSALSARQNRNGANGNSAPVPVSGHEISDYILTEILAQQSDEIRQFLLDTACCLRLCASLCDTVLNRNDSQDLLDELSHRHLFLIPLDARDEWFRYQDLFREALFHRLQQTDPDRLTQLQTRAIQWFLDNNGIQEAIGQIIQLADWQWLEEVLEAHGNNLIHGGYHLPVLEWMARLPEDRLESNPRLAMQRIWAHFFANRLDQIEPGLARLENMLDERVADSHPEADIAIALSSEIALMRSYLARTHSDRESASQLSRQVLQDIDHTKIPLKSVTYYGIGIDHFSEGNLKAAEEALKTAVRSGQLERKASTVLSSGGLLSWIQYNRGHNNLALNTAHEVREWVDRHYDDPSQPTLISCWQNCALVEIYREKDEPDLSATYLAPLESHLESGIEPGQHIIVQFTRAHLAFSRGDYRAAIESIDNAESVLAQSRDQIVFEPPSLAALKARCWLAQGELQNASAWLSGLDDLASRNPINREQNQITAARVLIALGQPSAAIERLSPLRLATERDGHLRHLIEVVTVYAEALAKLGKQSEALSAMCEALKRGAREDFFRLFIEESPLVHRLIRQVEDTHLPQAYLAALRNRLPEEIPVKASGQAPGLVEPLSAREMEVLQSINEGLSNRAIAETMSVAATTVKAHIRNLYGKLNVGSRTEALAKARRLGLLE